MKEQFSKIDASLKELLQICKNAPTNNKTAYNYVQQYNSIMVDYQTKLQNIKAQRRLNNKSFNSAVSKFQAAHSATNKNGKEGVGPKNSWKKATKSALASRKVPQKRNLAHRGSPMELLAQLDRMGIDQNELNISFKKVYEEKMKQKNRQDDGLNTERAKILLLDAFATRDPNHVRTPYIYVHTHAHSLLHICMHTLTLLITDLIITFRYYYVSVDIISYIQLLLYDISFDSYAFCLC